MSLTEIEKLTAANACYAMASGRFADMINRENRGRSFSWNTFSEDMAERCEVEIILYVSTEGWPKEKVNALKRTSKGFGREIAAMLVERAGLA